MHYRKVVMQMSLGYRINHVQYNAGLLYKYRKLNYIWGFIFFSYEKFFALAIFPDTQVTLAK